MKLLIKYFPHNYKQRIEKVVLRAFALEGSGLVTIYLKLIDLY